MLRVQGPTETIRRTKGRNEFLKLKSQKCPMKCDVCNNNVFRLCIFFV